MTVGAVVWLTGLPASGKSTLATKLAERVRAAGREPIILDGDAVREILVPRLGYDDEGRDAFYRTLGGIASLVAHQGAIVLVPATAHRRAWRDLARSRAPRFVEVHVATPLEECRRRDPKQLYARGTGAEAGYEPPVRAEVTARPDDDEAAIAAVLAQLRLGDAWR